MIESILSDIPATPPKVDARHSVSKEYLVESRESAQSNLNPSLPKKESTENLPRPDIERVSKRKQRDPDELIETLSKQTGLTQEQIEELFNGTKNIKTEAQTSPQQKQ